MKKKIIFATIFFINVILMYSQNFDPMIIGSKINDIQSYILSEGGSIKDVRTVPGKEINVFDFDVNAAFKISYTDVEIAQIFVNKKNIIIGASYIIYNENYGVEDYMSVILDIISENKIAVEKKLDLKNDKFETLYGFIGSTDEIDVSFEISYSDVVGYFLSFVMTRI